jgi:hypothetical protein
MILLDTPLRRTNRRLHGGNVCELVVPHLQLANIR